MKHNGSQAAKAWPLIIGAFVLLVPHAHAQRAGSADEKSSSRSSDSGSSGSGAASVEALGNVLQQIFQQNAERKRSQAARATAEDEKIEAEIAEAFDRYQVSRQEAFDQAASREVQRRAREAEVIRNRDALERLAATGAGLPPITNSVTILDFGKRNPDGSPTETILPGGPIPAEITFETPKKMSPENAGLWREALSELPERANPTNDKWTTDLLEGSSRSGPIGADKSAIPAEIATRSPEVNRAIPSPAGAVTSTATTTGNTDTGGEIKFLPMGEEDISFPATPEGIRAGLAYLKDREPKKLLDRIPGIDRLKSFGVKMTAPLAAQWESFKKNKDEKLQEIFPWATVEEFDQ